MAWSVYCKIFAAITLILFFGHNTAQSQKFYRVYILGSTESCKRADAHHYGLQISSVYQVLYNKTSRQIITGADRFPEGYFYVDFDWRHTGYTWETPDVGFGMFILVRHTRADLSRNDNPPTNPQQLRKFFRKGRPDPGRGSDFSAIFKENAQFQNLMMYYEGQRIMNFAGTKCAQTEAWIANEGVYKWDERNNAWTPVYYQPWKTGFYY